MTSNDRQSIVRFSLFPVFFLVLTAQIQALDAPVLLKPDDLETYTTAEAFGVGIQFRWSPVTGAEDYDLVFSINNSLNIRSVGSTSPSMQLKFGSPSGTLVYWSVQAVAGGQTGPQSATRTFTIQDPPTATPTPDPNAPTPTPTPTFDVLPAPTLLEPEDGVQLHPNEIASGVLLTWTAVDGAAGYRINNLVNNIPKPPLTSEETEITLSLEVEDGDVITWNVAGLDSAGKIGLFSQVRQIVAETAAATPTPTPPGGILPAPALIEPENGLSITAPQGATQSIQFTWDQVAGAAGYRFSIAENDNPPSETNLPLINSIPITFTFDHTRTITWSVTAIDAEQLLGETSEGRTLTLALEQEPSPTPTPSPTPIISIADINRDADVDIYDVFYLSSQFQNDDFNPDVDLDQNNIINKADVWLFVEAYKNDR